jgi:hypothetical protein
MPKGIPKNGINKGWLKKGHQPSEETKLKIGAYSKLKKNNLGKKQSAEWKENISKGLKGHKRSLETRLNMSKGQMGEKGSQWKGGIYKFTEHVRDCFEYRQWRSDVFSRDDFTCQMCFIKGGHLHAHHIKHLSVILQEYKLTNLIDAKECAELWNINNGMTLCTSCHKQIHKK